MNRLAPNFLFCFALHFGLIGIKAPANRFAGALALRHEFGGHAIQEREVGAAL